jgi:hypothetical protein
LRQRGGASGVDFEATDDLTHDDVEIIGQRPIGVPLEQEHKTEIGQHEREADGASAVQRQAKPD